MSTQTVDLVICNVNLCKEDTLNSTHTGTFTVACSSGQVVSVEPSSSPNGLILAAEKEIDAQGRGLLIPGCCRCFVLLIHVKARGGLV